VQIHESQCDNSRWRAIEAPGSRQGPARGRWTTFTGTPDQFGVARRTSEVFISGRAGVDCSHLNCPILLDKFSGAGPLAGIELTLAALINARLLALSVDLPEMTETLLNAMAEASPEHLGVIPRLCGR
jgi:hypothetical protein